MPFSNRNAYYLRISPYTVLPLYLYLDERHTSWMTDATLQLVLEDLRHRIGPKLREESALIMNTSAAAKTKPTVDVHRGSNYQFAYFLRRADPHTLLVKRRNFVLRPASPKVKKEDPQPADPPATSGKKRGKGKAAPKPKPKPKPKTAEAGEPDGPPRGRKRKAGERGASEVDGPEPGEEEAAVTPRRSARTRTTISYAEEDDDDEEGEAKVDDFVPGGEPDEPMEEDTPPSLSPAPPPAPLFRPSTPPRAPDEIEEIKPEPVDASLNGSVPPSPAHTGTGLIDFSQDVSGDEAEDEDEESKPKPLLQLTFQGFSIFGCALCVIVEPFPPMRYSAVPAPRARQASLSAVWGAGRSMSRSVSASMEPVSLEDMDVDAGAGGRGATPLFRPETPFDDERFGSAAGGREQTPLFRLETPEPDMRGGSGGGGGTRFAAGRGRDRGETPLFRLETPEPDMMRGASLAPSLRSPSPFSFGGGDGDGDGDGEDEDGSTIMEFSQVLSSAGAGRFGGRDDADEEGGEGFYADADEGAGGNM